MISEGKIVETHIICFLKDNTNGNILTMACFYEDCSLQRLFQYTFLDSDCPITGPTLPVRQLVFQFLQDDFQSILLHLLELLCYLQNLWLIDGT